MKKITTFFVSALAAVTILAGCSNFNLDKGSVSGNGIEGETSFNVVVENFADLNAGVASQEALSASVMARTIVTEEYTQSYLKYVLFGTMTTKPSVTFYKAFETLDTDGKITLTGIKMASWDFTLAAYPNTATVPAEGDVSSEDDLITDDIVLIGYNTSDLKYGGTDVGFTLLPDGLTTPSDIALKLSTKVAANVLENYTVKAGIYYLETGAVVSTGEGDTTTSTETELTLTTSEPTDVNFKVSQMNPGTYTFEVTFTQKGNEKVYFVWNDTIVVIPGKTLEESIVIPDVIGDLPADVTTFTAAIVKDSEDYANGYYKVEFDWSDVSTINTERYYEIDLAEIPEETTDASTFAFTDATETVEANYETIGLNFRQSKYYAEGSLMANNSTATFALELGKRYTARIVAVNHAGRSENPCVVDLSRFGATDEEGTAIADPTSINRYRVTYNLQGGTYDEDGEGDTSEPSTQNIVVYHTQNGTAYTLISPNDTAPTLTKNGVSFTQWNDSSNTKQWAESEDENASTTTYSGYENLTLNAYYGTTELPFDIYNLSAYEIQSDWIKVNNTALTDDDAATISIATTGDQALTDQEVTFTVAESTEENSPFKTGFAYKTVIFELKYGGETIYSDTQDGAAIPDANTFTIPGTSLETLEAGNYQAKITAKVDSASLNYATVSKTFTIQITN